MVNFIDTHCNLNDEAYIDDFDQLLSRMKDAGICACIVPGVEKASYESLIDVTDRLPDYAYPCIGLHPTCLEDWESELVFLKKHLSDRKFYAIGETGMDEYWSKDNIPVQKRVFAEQIELSLNNNLPLIIHCRDAMEDTLSVLNDFRNSNVRGVFHAYSGSYESYREIHRYGDFKFGIGGVITYKNAGIAGIIHKFSMDDIILETDCPWLTPIPFRGKRNESSYIPYIAEKISVLTGLSIEQISEITTSNTKKLFGI